MFEILKKEKNRRYGRIKTLHGNIITPAFFPDATYGSVKMLSFEDVARTCTEQILCTTLHLHIRPGDRYIKKMGGMHNYFNWQKPIITDSGGWQVFSLIHQSKRGKITKEGAEFVLPSDGSRHKLTPESSIRIQKNLGSDIYVVLDDPIIGSSSYKKNKISVDITIEWAKRAKNEFLKVFKMTEKEFNDTSKKQRPLLFSVIQGGNYRKLREECAKKLIDIGFDGFGYGGILLKNDKKNTRKMLKYFSKIVPENKIRYGMGVGKPDDIKFCLENGYDMFDCVVPTRNGRHGQCFTKKGSINLKSNKYKYDKRPIDKTCSCIACETINGKAKTSRAYLSHLLKMKEVTAMRLCSMHNLTFYNKLLNKENC